MINYNQYREFALYSGIVSSAFLTYNLFKFSKRRFNSIAIDPDITKDQVLSQWKSFFSRERDPVRDFFNKNLYYLLLIENKSSTNHINHINHNQLSQEEQKYQKLNNFVVDLKNKKKEMQREERIFFNFVSDYAKVANRMKNSNSNNGNENHPKQYVLNQ